MTRYAAFLRRELIRRGHSVQLLAPAVRLRSLLPQEHRLGKWLGYLDKYVLFRWGFARHIRDADLVHICDHSNSPYLAWVNDKPKVITAHDAFGIRSALGHYPQNPTGASGRKLQQWILNSFSHADHILYVSEKTREDFTQVLSVTAASDVALHSLNWSYGPATAEQVEGTLSPLGLTAGKYLLHVGANQWYKNRLGVLEAYSHVKSQERFRDLKLVMAGKPLTGEMRLWVEQHSLQDVIELLDVSNEQLQALYSGATALLFPSLQEGFGWPLLEAQACGCPVITSDRAPMTEIAGKGAVYFDPEQPAMAVSALDQVVARRRDLIAAGTENLQRFTVEEMISRYEAAYRSVLERTGSKPR